MIAREDSMSAAQAVEALVVAARKVARAALELEQLVERAVQIPDVLVQLFGVDSEVDAAAATVSLRLSTQGADGVGELLSALRARHVDLRAIHAELTHRFGPFQLSIGREPRVGGGGQTASADFATFSAPAPAAGAGPYRRSHGLSPRCGRIAFAGVRLPILPIAADEWGVAHDPQ